MNRFSTDVFLVYMESQKITYAKGIKGKRGDIILQLNNGKIAFPRGFTPREGEWYLVEVVEDRGRYAFAVLHKHDVGLTGICLKCGRVADKAKLEKFVEQWWKNLIRNKERLKEIGEIKGFLTARFGDLIVEIGDMIYRLEREKERHMTSEYICPPGYGVIDSCFSYYCADKHCERLEHIIRYLRYIRDAVLEERFERIKRFTESDHVMTVDNLGIRLVPII